MNLHSKTKFNPLLWEHLLELLLLMILLKLIKLTVTLLECIQISKKELKGINSQSSVLLNVPLMSMKSLELISMLKNLKFVKLLFMLV
jgi:hypothetical protein